MNQQEEDEFYMREALQLAERGRGKTRPNPLVGAVIVKEGRVIGRGWHEQYGENHAEINAFLDAPEDVKGGTMYVNLEPCAHYGKTPPCAKKVVEKQIVRVVIGILDPNPKVAGKGAELLQEAGIEVVIGVLEKECRKINEIFLKYIQTRVPFIVYKAAMSLDGKTATVGGESKWISSEESRETVAQLRGEYAGIMVGINTVLADNPRLTCRWPGGRNPVRIVVDSHLKIPLDAQVLKDQSKAKTIIATTEEAGKLKGIRSSKQEELRKQGIRVITTPSLTGRVDLKALVKELGRQGVDGILLEGGAALAFSCLEAGIVDKVQFFFTPQIFGGKDANGAVGGVGIKAIADAIQLTGINTKKVGRDICIEGYVKREGLCLQEL